MGSGLLLARQGSDASPVGTVLAFAKALQRHDFKAMAALVEGGQTGFDYSQILGEDQQLDQRYTRVTFKLHRVKITGNHAQVTGDLGFSTPDDRGGEQQGETVPLILENGTWKIVPNDHKGQAGHFIEEFANNLAHPEEILARQSQYLAPTRNLTATTLALGKARARFFQKILDISDRHNQDDPPYSGYKSMAMIEHTTMLWPLGRADEVIFFFTGERASYLTGWRQIGGVPKRLWQVTLPYVHARRAKPARGALGRWLVDQKVGLPARPSPELRKALAAVRPYAAYHETGAVAIFTCWVVFDGGDEKPEMASLSLRSIRQDSYQAIARGFFITPDEVTRLAAVPK